MEGERGGRARGKMSEGIVKSFQGRDVKLSCFRGVDMATVSLQQVCPLVYWAASIELAMSKLFHQ